jgi:hypothetical protein
LEIGTTPAACAPWRCPRGAVKGKRAAAVELRGTGKAAWGKEGYPARCVALEIVVMLVAMIPKRLCWHVAGQGRGKA